jgi:putative endonuclease
VSQEIKRFVYVLHSLASPDRQFVECAANVPMRIAAHNAGHSPLTAAHRPWRLVTVVQFGNEVTAQRFEKFLQSSAGRAFSKQHFT